MGAIGVLRAPASGLWSDVRRACTLLRVSAALLVFSVFWFAVNMVTEVGPPVLLWLPAPVGGVALALLYHRTSRMAALPAPTRRFWRHLSIVAVMVGIASTAQGVDVLAHPDAGGPHLSWVMIAFDGGACVTIVYALFRLPLARQTGGELLRLVLDAGTVILAAAVFLWHFQTRKFLDDDRIGLVNSLVLTLLALVAVFAVAKVVLSSYPFIDNGALRSLATAMFLGAAAPAVQPFIERLWPHLFVMMVGIPLVFFFASLAGERQRRAADRGPRRGAAQPRRRSFSMLPYAAVAAVDGLLVAATFGGDSDDRVVVAAAVVLTALVIVRQVTAFRDNGRLLARLDHGASHDALTQLPNRALFGERLQKALSADTRRPVAVALIDLDDFKEVNDTLGHEVGDQLLVAVAQRLQGCVRAGDTVARLGGDEFVVLLDAADRAAADSAAERMMAALRGPALADGHELPIRASIGIADGHTGDEASVLLRHADIAMYAAKSLAGTAYLHYEAAMAAAVTDHAHLGAELRRAIAGGELFLLYQPIIALRDGRVVGAEALVRWAHPRQGTLAPDTFIPVAERTGLVVPLSRWVMREAFRQLARWVAVHGAAAPGVLSVNVSARDLREPGFAAGVAALLDEYGVPPGRITFEITESMALEPGPSVAALHQLRSLGVRLSLDDFGTGQSTLSLLHDCPIDEIKLDRSFTQATGDGRPPVAAAVIQLAGALGLHAVAEGVETAEQAERLGSLGYAAAQGYYFGRPMTPERFGELLAAGTVPRPAARVR
jgi:diguanylate cyclase